MGCFKACFGTRKRSKTKKPAANLAQETNTCHDREINEVLQCVYSNTDELKITDPITSVIKENTGEEEKQSIEREKVAFHSDMMNSSRKESSLLIENGEDNETTKDDEIGAVESLDSGGSSSLFTYPRNHRYHNCTSSSDDEDEEPEVTKLDKEPEVTNEEESSESLFSLPIDSRKGIPAEKLEEKEVNSPLKQATRIEKITKRQCILQSVLKPIDNLSEWRSVKEKSSALNDEEKENNNNNNNKNMFFEEAVIEKSESKKTRNEDDVENEIGVETSLSSWLKSDENDSPVSVGTCSKKRSVNTSKSFDDRPILGDLTLKLSNQDEKNVPIRRFELEEAQMNIKK